MPSQRDPLRRRPALHRRLSLESLEQRRLLAGDVVISEIKIRPPETENGFDYIEIRGVPGMSLTSMSFVSVDGDGNDSGQADVVVSLTNKVIGSNGLLVIKGTTGGHSVAPGTTVVTDAQLDGNGLESGTNTFMLVRGPIAKPSDSDPNNDGILDAPLANFTIVDSVAVRDATGSSDRVYGGVVVTVPGTWPQAVTRFLHDNRPLTANAWYGGTLSGANSSVTYATLSANFPAGGALTPGEVNIPGVNSAPVGSADFYAIEIDGSISLFDPALGVLANDSDPDDSLAPGGKVDLSAQLVETIPGLAFRPDGTFSFNDFGGTEPRTVTFTYRATDMNLLSEEITVTIQVGAAPNQSPVVTVPSGPLVYVENAPPLLLDAAGSATVTDTDSTDFDTGKLTVRLAAGGTVDDRLTILHQGTATGEVGVSGTSITYGGVDIGTFTGDGSTAPLEITFNADSSPASAQAVLRRVSYQNHSDNPSPLARTIEWLLTDGDGGSSDVVTTVIQVTAENDAPILELPGLDANYAASAPATIVDDSATVSDLDSADFDDGALTIDITAGGDAGDVLGIAHGGTDPGQIGVNGAEVTFGGVLIGAFSGGAGSPLVIMLNAAATPGAVEALARSITYRNTLPLPAIIPRTIRFVLTDGDGGTSLPTTATVNVSRPPLPGISIADAAISEGHSESKSLSFAVMLSSIPVADVVVTYSTLDGTATVADGDYLSVTGGTLTFLAGTTELTQNIAITIAGDNKFELDDQFSVSIAATGADIVDGTALGTITNDDARPTVSIDPITVTEGNSGTTSLVFAVSISNPSYQDIVVSYTTSDGTATLADNDYTLTSGSLMFLTSIAPTPQTITVPAVGDLAVEPTETFTLALTNTGAANTTASATGTIENDDFPAPPVFFGEAQSDLDGLLIASDSGVPGDRITSDTTPTLWGTSAPAAIVRLYIDQNGNQLVDAADLLIAQATADALSGNWQATSLVALGAGTQRLLVTAENAIGKVSIPDAGSSLAIVIDTQAPAVTGVAVTSAPTFDLFSIQPALNGPTPLVTSLTIRTSEALAQSSAESPANYELRGDFSGIIPIASITHSTNSQSGQGTIVLSFAKPLPDDRYTLTLHDTLIDRAGHALDGFVNSDAPISTPRFAGDGQPGGDFVVHFTVDARAEIGTWLESLAHVDTNGNGTLDPSSGSFSQRDITYVLGQAPSAVFTGDFALDLSSNGFDKLATYVVSGEQHYFLVDVDHDGIADNAATELPEGFTRLNISGQPVAGRFDSSDLNGDEVGVFDGTTWYFDTNHNFILDSGDVSLVSELRGAPIVGDFDGDGFDDLATWADDHFQIDLARGSRRRWDGVADFTVRFGFVSTLEQPVAADMNGDGIDDLGLYIPDALLEGSATGQWYFIVSSANGDGVPIPLVKFDHAPNDPGHRVQLDPNTQEPAFFFRQETFGDLLFTFGGGAAQAIVGNFDPPVTATGTSGGVAVGVFTNPEDPLDVDGDGEITPTDAALVYNQLNATGALTLTSTFRSVSGPFVDVSGDGVLSPEDALLIYNYLNAGGSGEAQAELTDALPSSNDDNAVVAEQLSSVEDRSANFAGESSLPALWYWAANNAGHDFGAARSSAEEEDLEDLLALIAVDQLEEN